MPTKREIVRGLIDGEADFDTTDIASFTVGTRGPGETGPLDEELAKTAQDLLDELIVDASRVIDWFEQFYGHIFDDEEDVRGLIELVKFAATEPEEFFDQISDAPTRDVRGVGDWIDKVRAWIHLPKDASTSQRAKVSCVVAQHGWSDGWWKKINPNIRKFEKPDPGWWGAWRGGLAERRNEWPDLAEFREHSAADPFIHETASTSDGSIEVALFSDFGNGTYQAKGIAHQLARWKYPEVFHLGDVYYKGTQKEFKKYFEKPLAPVLKSSRMYCLPENHELFAGGGTYHAYIDSQPNVPHVGSYFCVRYPKHQIIGIDVNWQSRQRLEPVSSQHKWLEYVLATGVDRTTILVTGSAPYIYGKAKKQRLLADMKSYLSKIDFWFWGDNHYCALFDTHQEAPFFGSCVGHGGFPHGVYGDKTTWVDCLWVEKTARFPAWSKLRQDRGNNGWCQATLYPSGGVDLLYVDWLGAKRCLARFKRLERGGNERHCLKLDRLSSGKKVVEFPRAADGETFEQLVARGALHHP